MDIVISSHLVGVNDSPLGPDPCYHPNSMKEISRLQLQLCLAETRII
jgi:hypothetical protein